MEDWLGGNSCFDHARIGGGAERDGSGEGGDSK